MIGRQLGHYHVVEAIGAGGMGEVYRAWDETLQRDVALKVLPEGQLSNADARQRFHREALALSKLNHPHIATVYDFGSEDRLDYIVMEHVEGPTLERLMVESSLSEDEIRRIGLQMTEAMAEAHERGVVHRDLKPANIKLTAKGQVKILDFGLARLMPRESGENATTLLQTTTPDFAGTVPYMAPEQLRGRPPGTQTDVWSMGVVLYELLAKRRPFAGDSAFEISSSILQAEPKPLPAAVAEDLRAVVDRCLQKDPQRRFQHAGEVRVALDMAGTGTAVLRRPPRRRLSRRTTVAAAVVALIAALTLLAVEVFRRAGGSAPGTVASRIVSLAALPSDVVSADEDRFLTEAIPQTLSSHLSRIDGLVTKASPTRSQIERFAGDRQLLADAYDVSAFVVSSATVHEGRLVLNIQLVDAATEQVLWGDIYQGSEELYLDLVREAVDGIRRTIRPGTEPISAGGLPRNSEAELALRRGLYYLNLYYTRGLAKDFERVSEAFHQALDLDPSFADASAGIAQLHLLEITRGGDPATAFARTEMWAQRALRDDPQSSQAWQLLSALETLRPGGDERRALEYALKASAADPRNRYAHIALAESLVKTSMYLAFAAYSEAPRHNPLDLSSSAAAAALLAVLGRRSDALAELDRVLRIEPDLPAALLIKAMMMVRSDTDEAARLLARVEELNAGGAFPPQVVGLARDSLGFVRLLDQGDREAAALLKQKLTRLARGEAELFPYWARVTQGVAPLMAAHEEGQAALEVLTARVAKDATDPYDYLLWNPDFESIRDQTGFAGVLSAARDRLDETVAVLEAARVEDALPAYMVEALDGLMVRIGSPADA